MPMYGSGNPLWGKEQEKKGGLNNRYQGQSYQKDGSGYQPPNVGGTYAEQQTGVLEDTMKHQYEVRV